ncbi:hypothetical protein HBI40_018860 [Parastagonospora nodorum]|nr:hypothetical protein HBH71_038940 [Parastagonospora nodorum]KAH5391758.1 hypothetical protein HBI33_016010 [Parastagonospora nodorum]KAH5453583.1 hypothetical protein HBI30_102720 [Parastagonospora nodorum]KAH5698966.1 hypothetical protein HBI44_072860 [Parastagonospora nodorum]KAH6278564.1 hypothetical protein HBI41_044540 [Parastagonospora nodorum]
MPTSPVVMSCLDNHARPLRLTIALRSTCARTASDSLISLKRRAMRLGSHKQRAEATSAQLPIYAFFFPEEFREPQRTAHCRIRGQSRRCWRRDLRFGRDLTHDNEMHQEALSHHTA